MDYNNITVSDAAGSLQLFIS